MKRRHPTSDERRDYDPANARLFNYLPGHIRDSLSAAQRVAIVETILMLQRDDPRILDEIYMERPYPGTPHHAWTTGQRLRRRIGWTLRRAWLASLRQKSERRVRNRVSDYLFVLFMGALALAALALVFLLFYWVKSLLGVDLYADEHLFG